jgi:hypothetical protein
MLIISADAIRNSTPITESCSLDVIRKDEGDSFYETRFDTKYHIGDSFVHPCGLTAYVTEVNDRCGEYHLTFVETQSKRAIVTALKTAWYTDAELDNFVNTIDRDFCRSYL